jgi:hypothetical protein
MMSGKNDIQLVESTSATGTDLKALPAQEARVPLPAEIAHLTLDEQEALEIHIVRKMDRRLMPILIVM